jgi:hypothetical protein
MDKYFDIVRGELKAPAQEEEVKAEVPSEDSEENDQVYNALDHINDNSLRVSRRTTHSFAG